VPEPTALGDRAAPAVRPPGIAYAGIGDEAASSLAGQLAAVRSLGWDALELRTVDGVAVADLSDRAFDAVAADVADAGCRVTCLDSRIAGWARPVSGPFEDDLRELAVLVRRATALGTPYVRVMSYPNDGLDDATWRRVVVERLRRLAALAEPAGLVLLHENCSGWAAASAERMLDLLDAVDSAALALLLDTGNGHGLGYCAYDVLREVVDRVAYVHVKDATGPANAPIYCFPGQGSCRVADCLRLLLDHGYRGVWSIEPHLLVRPHEGALEPGADGPATFVRYGRALERLVASLHATPPAPAPGRQRAAGATSAASPGAVPLSGAERDLLLHLLELPTAGPLETGDCSTRLHEAQLAYAQAAAELGMRVVCHGPAARAEALAEPVPRPVRDAVDGLPGYLACQPNLVLRLGPERPTEATVMLNVHLDTVGGWWPPRLRGGLVEGRGAIDAKGPAVAVLAGLRAAAAAVPAIGATVAVIVQAVGGEEGGAMGCHGTRPLVQRGHVGRWNLFCEPTGRRLLTRATAAMTPCVRVDGEDAIDDQPGAGHNATALLGFLAQHLAERLAGLPADARACVAGLCTGHLHNRAPGAGQLLLNLAYGSAATAAVVESTFAAAVADGLAAFADRFAGVPDLARTAREATRVTSVEWRKRGLPALASADPATEELVLRAAGLRRWPPDEPAFTCDAIWLHDRPDAFTAVIGPGDLAANCAHADGEHAELAELEAFAGDVARIVAAFAGGAEEGRP
jgi:sugar phosphate isomerase/epimerase/acetylornithine deacetylase/succinyl-diaminopimelate desuccinylase-like protein